MKTLLFIGFIVNITFCNLLLADAFDECKNEKITTFKKVEDFSRDAEVSCEGAGISGVGHSKNGSASFTAAPGYQIVGNILIDDLSRNNGNYGEAIYDKDNTGKIVKVTVPISCSSPSKLFGPGAWMKIRIRGKAEITPTKDDLKTIYNNCSDKLMP